MKTQALTESHKALLVLAAVMAAGLLSALVYAAQSRAEQGFLAVASVAVLLAGASAFLTLSPFFGQFRGFLKVDRKPASRDHFIHFEG